MAAIDRKSRVLLAYSALCRNLKKPENTGCLVCALG
jgi:hypothetical protein